MMGSEARFYRRQKVPLFEVGNNMERNKSFTGFRHKRKMRFNLSCNLAKYLDRGWGFKGWKHNRRAPHHVIQATASEGVATGSYVTSKVGFELATFRTEGTKQDQLATTPNYYHNSFCSSSSSGNSSTTVVVVTAAVEIIIILIN